MKNWNCIQSNPRSFYTCWNSSHSPRRPARAQHMCYSFVLFGKSQSGWIQGPRLIKHLGVCVYGCMVPGQRPTNRLACGWLIDEASNGATSDTSSSACIKLWPFSVHTNFNLPFALHFLSFQFLFSCCHFCITSFHGFVGE